MPTVLFIHHSGLIGGAGVSLYNVVKTAAEQNKVFVALSSEPDDMVNMFQTLVNEANVTIIPYGRRIGAVTYYSGGDSIFSPRFVYRAFLILKQKHYWNRLIKEINPDIIVVNSKTTSWISRLSEVKKRSSICFVRETIKGNRNNLINRYFSNCLDDFSVVVFLSGFDKKQERLKNAKSEVIHNYVADDQFDTTMSRSEASKKLNLEEETFHVLYVGGVTAIKGFDIAVKTILSCPKNIQLIVAGNDFALAANTKDKRAKKYVDYWKNYVANNDKHGQIRFVGKQHDMSACYSCADVVLFPMREPHQARPAFESGYFKKPIVITDFENIQEFVSGGYNGLLAKNEDIDEFKNCITKLANDTEYRKQLGYNNYMNSMENHNQIVICQRITHIIEELA